MAVTVSELLCPPASNVVCVIVRRFCSLASPCKKSIIFLHLTLGKIVKNTLRMHRPSQAQKLWDIDAKKYELGGGRQPPIIT